MIEIIPQARASRPGWVNVILVAALVFLLIAVAGQFIFGAMSAGVRRDIEEASRRIKELSSPDRVALEKAVLDYQTQFANFSDTLAKRYLASRVLGLLEETAHPGILYRSLNIDLEQASIQAKAEAANYQAIGEQLLVFNNEKRISRVETENYDRNKEGQIIFDLMLNFNPDIIISNEI